MSDTVIVLFWVLLGALFAALGVLALRAMRHGSHRPTGTWVARSGKDRRQRRIPVRVDRRRRPRREEDVARTFVDGMRSRRTGA